MCNTGVLELTYPASLRLRRGWEFDTVFRIGRRCSGGLVRLLFLEVSGETTRFGVVAGKKQGNACIRSRGRRVLREAARRLAPWTCCGYWLVLGLSRKGLESDARRIYLDLASLMDHAGLLTADWPGPQW
ncbi:MAG: ribonuclease P protein component [Dethiosulfovibrio peptidovorans]|nr:MAG: ribonuclease P protein component [Dethiosulfovibrio peptidovorans]